MLSRDSVHLSELQRDPNKYVKYKFKKTIFLSPEIVKWNSFMLFLLMMMNSASASLQVLRMSAACISLHTFQRTLRVSTCRGQRTWRKVTKLEYPIPQYRKKNWHIPKYRVKNRRNTDTAFIFGIGYLPMSPLAWRNFVTFLQVRWPLHALTRNVRWNVCNEIQATHIQSTWRLAEAEFIIINRKNIKLSHSRFLVIERLFFFFNLYFTYLFGSRCSSDKWTLSRDNISKIQLSLADGNFELFSFSANLSFSFLF